VFSLALWFDPNWQARADVYTLHLALLKILGKSMAWFSNEFLPMLLYAPPAFLGGFVRSLSPSLPPARSPLPDFVAIIEDNYER
jgi:hypothetical protein